MSVRPMRAAKRRAFVYGKECAAHCRLQCAASLFLLTERLRRPLQNAAARCSFAKRRRARDVHAAFPAFASDAATRTSHPVRRAPFKQFSAEKPKASAGGSDLFPHFSQKSVRIAGSRIALLGERDGSGKIRPGIDVMRAQPFGIVVKKRHVIV